MKTDAVVKQLQASVVDPFINSLKGEGQATLNSMITQSEKQLREAIVGALEREEARYVKEMEKKPVNAKQSHLLAISRPLLCAALSSLCDCIAAAAAMAELQNASSRTSGRHGADSGPSRMK